MRSLLLCTASPLLASSASLLPASHWMVFRPTSLLGLQRSRALMATADEPPLPSWLPESFTGFDDTDDAESETEGASPPAPRRRPPSQSVRPMYSALEASLEMPRGVCLGCGAHFQSDDDEAPGFVPQNVLEERLGSSAAADTGKRMPVCQRCHGLRYQNRLPTDSLRVGCGEATHAELQPDYFVQMLRDISRQRCVVVAIVDLFDFHGSLVPDLASVIGPHNRLILVGNKKDLLPSRISMRAVEWWVRAEARKAKLPSIESVHLVSCRTGEGMPKLLSELHDTMRAKQLDAYVVGAANAGKSSFINHCLKHVGARKSGPSAVERSVTTSHLPGTTLDFVRVSVFAGRRSLFDTPGVILPNQLTTRLTTDELAMVVPKRRAQHVTLRVAEGKSVLLGGVARLHMRSGRPFLFTFYLANAVQIHPTDTSKVDAVLEKHTGNLLAPPASYERLEQLGTFEETTFHVDGRGWDDAAIDLVLPGLGWVAVTGSGSCTVSIELPSPVRAIGREPLIPSESAKGARRSRVKFTGSKLRDAKGNTRRVRR